MLLYIDIQMMRPLKWNGRTFDLIDHHHQDFIEELSCGVSFVNRPLEHDWLSGDVKSPDIDPMTYGAQKSLVT